MTKELLPGYSSEQEMAQRWDTLRKKYRRAVQGGPLLSLEEAKEFDALDTLWRQRMDRTNNILFYVCLVAFLALVGIVLVSLAGAYS